MEPKLSEKLKSWTSKIKSLYLNIKNQIISEFSGLLGICLFILSLVLIKSIVKILLIQYIYLALLIWVLGGISLYFFLKAIWPSLYNTKYFGWLGFTLIFITGISIFLFVAQHLILQHEFIAGAFWIIWGFIFLKRLLYWLVFMSRAYQAWFATATFFLLGVLTYASPITMLIPAAITSIAQQIQSEKTLWNWLTAVIIPILIPLSIAFWSLLQQKSQQKIADGNLREEALEKYIDFLSKNTPSMEISLKAIRVKTLSILRRLKTDGERKGTAIKFLYDTDILKRRDLDLSGADLTGIRLETSKLAGANLRGTRLDRASLDRCDLKNADLVGASLVRASVARVNLCHADLSFANLVGANFLFSADLFSADSNVTNLNVTNLSGAILLKANLKAALVIKEQLEGKNPPLICKTELSSDIEIDPNRDCKKLSQVIKDRYPNLFNSIEEAETYIDRL